MEFSNFRPESHVAQQSRRDKLRVQQSSTAEAQNLEDYTNNFEQLSVHQGLNPNLIQVSNVRYGNISYNNPPMFSSEMINFSANSQLLLAHKDAMAAAGVHQESSGRPVAHETASFGHDSQNCGTWKSTTSSQHTCDWIANYSNTGLTGPFVGEGLANPGKVNDISSSSSLYLKPGFNGYQDVQSSLTNPSSEVSSQNSQKHYEEMHFTSPPLNNYQNTPGLAVVASTAAAGSTEGLELDSDGRGSWTDGGNELLLLHSFGGHQWSGELGFLANKGNNNNRSDSRTIASDCNTQGLSLSLSPVLPNNKTRAVQFGDDLHSGTAVFNDLRASKTLKSDYLCSISNSKPTVEVPGNSCQDLVGSTAFTRGNSGPLGPFTGYATILKGSKFLRPAQQLLDEICVVNAPKPMRTIEMSDKMFDEVKGSAGDISAAESFVGCKSSGGNPGASSSTFYNASDISGEEAGVWNSSGECFQPEFQQKKAKLLFMQEEVCRRYKQYHQQMQMVVSSFESVAGLSAATPYISLALKTVSRHFRFLKNAISDQLKHIRKALGEDLSSPTTGASSSKGDTSTSRLKFIDHSFAKQKSGGGDLGFFEPQQHVWRPQRGLPERAVTILRAWLFDHFLHPYPTDTDKHMLASQTGLSRNQVSNWFINARVRVWKPMVEEIHMLETKGLAESNSHAGKTTDGESANAGRPNDYQPEKRLNNATVTSSMQVDCLRIGSSTEQWNREKRSRVECEVPASMDGSLMGFVPYPRGGVEIGGLGAVSLTLGLRQSAESAKQQQQLQQQEQQLRQHFGGPMIHDFVD